MSKPSVPPRPPRPDSRRRPTRLERIRRQRERDRIRADGGVHVPELLKPVVQDQPNKPSEGEAEAPSPPPLKDAGTLYAMVASMIDDAKPKG